MCRNLNIPSALNSFYRQKAEIREKCQKANSLMDRDLFSVNTTTSDLRGSDEKFETGQVMLSGVQDHANNAQIVGGENVKTF